MKQNDQPQHESIATEAEGTSSSTTNSTALLQNNIGALMLLKRNMMQEDEDEDQQKSILLEATQRFYASLALQEIQEKEQEPPTPAPAPAPAPALESQYCSSTIPALPIDLDESKINVDLPGLVWFHNRLYKSLTHNHNTSHHRLSNTYASYHHTHNVTNTIPKHKKLTVMDSLRIMPLGLEYYMYPIIIQDIKDVKLAAGINLALCLLLLSSNDSSLHPHVLQYLLWALHLQTKQDNHHHHHHHHQQQQHHTHTHHGDTQEQNDNPILRAIGHNNLGVLRYMQQKPNSAAQNFVKALDLLSLSSFTFSGPWISETVVTSNDSTVQKDLMHVQEDTTSSSSSTTTTTMTMTIPIHYTYITIQLNCTRTAIQIKHDKCSEYVQALIEHVLPTLEKEMLQYHHPTHTERLVYHSNNHHRMKWIMAQCKHYIPGLLYQHEEHYHASLEKFNDMLSITRKEWGHDHIYVATILEKKGMVSFEERRYHSAMLSYFASLKIYERHEGYDLEQSRLWYAIGRTLHDREEFSDALGMYRKALIVRQRMKKMEDQEDTIHTNADNQKSTTVETIQIWTNICRVCYILGDLQEAMNANERIIEMAIEMMKMSHNIMEDVVIERHAFVRNRMMVLGNLYVEMGRVEEAMEIFTRVARVNMDGDWHMWTSHGRPEVEDVDTNAFATKAAERLGNVVKLPPHAAAA
jgi:tetratricopeptide (TPR) repeat protein